MEEYNLCYLDRKSESGDTSFIKIECFKCYGATYLKAPARAKPDAKVPPKCSLCHRLPLSSDLIFLLTNDTFRGVTFLYLYDLIIIY